MTSQRGAACTRVNKRRLCITVICVTVINCPCFQDHGHLHLPPPQTGFDRVYQTLLPGFFTVFGLFETQDNLRILSIDDVSKSKYSYTVTHLLTQRDLGREKISII